MNGVQIQVGLKRLWYWNDDLDDCIMPGSTTFRIIRDASGRLAAAACITGKFWNYFLKPECPVLISIDLFSMAGAILAVSRQPILHAGNLAAMVSFNYRHLDAYNDIELFSTLAHEVGHVLIFRDDLRWLNLFDARTGSFKPAATEILPALAAMTVETHHGEGTRLLHWSAASHTGELMTGFKEPIQFLLPVTIDVAIFLGHHVNHHLDSPRTLKQLYCQFA